MSTRGGYSCIPITRAGSIKGAGRIFLNIFLNVQALLSKQGGNSKKFKRRAGSIKHILHNHINHKNVYICVLSLGVRYFQVYLKVNYFYSLPISVKAGEFSQNDDKSRL